jgi:hypothetical protein
MDRHLTAFMLIVILAALVSVSPAAGARCDGAVPLKDSFETLAEFPANEAGDHGSPDALATYLKHFINRRLGLRVVVGTWPSGFLDRLTYYQDADLDFVPENAGMKLEIRTPEIPRVLSHKGAHHGAVLPWNVLGVLSQQGDEGDELRVTLGIPETAARIFFRDLDEAVRGELECLAAKQRVRLEDTVKEVLNRLGLAGYFDTCALNPDRCFGPFLGDDELVEIESFLDSMVDGFSFEDYDEEAPPGVGNTVTLEYPGNTVGLVVAAIERRLASAPCGTLGNVDGVPGVTCEIQPTPGEPERYCEALDDGNRLPCAFFQALYSATSEQDVFEFLEPVLEQAVEVWTTELATLQPWIHFRTLALTGLWQDGARRMRTMEICQPFYASGVLNVPNAPGVSASPTFERFLVLPCKVAVWRDKRGVHVTALNPLSILGTYLDDVIPELLEQCTHGLQPACNAVTLFGLFPMIVHNDITALVNHVLKDLGEDEDVRMPYYDFSMLFPQP